MKILKTHKKPKSPLERHLTIFLRSVYKNDPWHFHYILSNCYFKIVFALIIVNLTDEKFLFGRSITFKSSPEATCYLPIS